ncbi:MAG TPA: hypothetical protein VEG60_10540, partial [Candidatus Binatia bacterium]|nr:hypothetical protein [Candidatus Binatia bacterium]
ILDFSRWGLNQEGTYAFWPMVFGGFFLYASYYGCDQSQVQRELTVAGMDNVKKSLLVNAFGRFPLVLLYAGLGVFIGAAVTAPEFPADAANVLHRSPDAIVSALDRDPDRMVPMFILTYIPHGLIGLFFVAILSALMSNLDSALNSMSAVTVRDFYQRYWKPDASREHYLFVSKVFTGCWGYFVSDSLCFSQGPPEATRQTTIVLINAHRQHSLRPHPSGVPARHVNPLGRPYGNQSGNCRRNHREPIPLVTHTHFVALVESHWIAGDCPHLVHRIALRDRARTSNFARGR